ncbi:MAG: hypothetical protein AAGI07_00265 [Bacteroidota bacterium]
MFKELIIETGMNTILKVLKRQKQRKGSSKIADFLFSDKTQNTLGTIYKEYNQALDEWEEENN